MRRQGRRAPPLLGARRCSPRAATTSVATGLHGTQVDPPFTVSDEPLVDTDGAPYSLTADTDKRLTLVFFGYTSCPDICGMVMANLASGDDPARRGRPGAGRRGVRDDRPGARHRRGAARLPRPLRPGFIGAHRRPRRHRAGRPRRSAWAWATKLPSGGYDVDAHTTTVTGIDVRRRGPGLLDQDTSPSEFADDIHTLLRED